jgi:hypothetical protein
VSKKENILYSTVAGSSGGELLFRGDEAYMRGPMVAQMMGDPKLWGLPASTNFTETWIPIPPEQKGFRRVGSDPYALFMLYRESFTNVTSSPPTEVNGHDGTLFHANLDPDTLLAELRKRYPEMAEGATKEEIVQSFPSEMDIFVGNDGLIYQTRGTTSNPLAPGEQVYNYYDFSLPITYPKPTNVVNPWK